MAFDLKAATPDTSFGSGAFIFGADSQAAASPSIYSESVIWTYWKTLANTWSAAQTVSVAGAASVPATIWTGAVLTGGTGTTNFPHIFFQPSGATASTTWSTAGTAFGANMATGFAGNLIDTMVAGSSKFSVDSTGRPTVYGANMSVTLGNGDWGGANFSVPYLRPATAGGHIAFDIMPNGGPDDVWIDVCSHDITNGSGNYETLSLYKAYAGDARVRTTFAGTGTQRSLQVGGATLKLTYGASNTVGWTVDGSGGLVAGTSSGIFVPTVANSTLASIGCSSATTSGFYTTNGYDWGYTRSGSAMWVSGFNAFRMSPDVTLAWSGSVGDPAAASDLILSRAAAATLQMGAADAAGPVAQTVQVQSVVAGTSNVAGADWTHKGSKGTGTGAGGKQIFQTAPAGSTGSTQNALATGLTITAPAVNMQPSVVVGNQALATTATDGFLYIPTCAGTPTGVPTAHTGRVAMVYDTTNDQFWIYDGAWRQPKTPAGAAIVTWQ